MKKVQIKSRLLTLVVLFPLFFMHLAIAEETIIQQEKISFEKCLKVITVSENKLSISAEIEYISAKKRAAVFTLTDGILKITCDKEAGNLTVSTKTN